MSILYYECLSGISGDMNLGAMIDLGVNETFLRTELQKLNLEGWELEVTRDQRHGISGTRVRVLTEHDHDDHDDHEHNHEHHNHSRDKQHLSHSHEHRHLSDITEIINSSSLSKEVKDLSLRIFRLIGEAEASVHNVPLEAIHFHEVGAVDSVIDIVGAAICFCSLKIDRVYVSDIELGGGTVKCDHGILPVPAPATAKLIAGFRVHSNGVSFEATTPTGAAILAALAKPAPDDLKYTIKKTGYGIGHKDNPQLPNILRVFFGETDNQGSSGHRSYMVECNIDDMNPELSEYICSKLFAAGAGDVWYTPVIMKKGRPAFTLSVICDEEQISSVREILFTETTTIGLRVLPFEKETLRREFEEMNTRFGKVTIKKSFYNNQLVSAKPEADRCAAIASETGLPMKTVMQEIISLLNNRDERGKDK